MTAKKKATKKSTKKVAVEAPTTVPEPTVEETLPVADNTPEAFPAFAEPSLWFKARLWFARAWTWLHRKLPRLVWYNQEVDVELAFTTLDLERMAAINEAFDALKKSGLEFDNSLGVVWHLDYSLKGPLRIKFIGHAKKPLKRWE